MATSEKLTYPLDHNKQEALNFALELVAGNHGILTAGSIWIDSSGNAGKGVLKWVETDGTTVNTVPLPAEGGGDADTLDGHDPTYFLARANHTGSQLASTISDFGAAVAALVLDADTLEGQNGAYYRARTNHTGTQLAATISDLATTVLAYRLDQFAAPTANVSMGNQKIVNLQAGASGTEAANVGQISSAVAGLASTTYVDDEIAALVDAAPGTLDTLNELAQALGDDPNFATTLTNQINARARKFSATIGNGSATQIDVAHGFGNRDIIYSVWETATPWGKVRPGPEQPDTNTLRLSFTTPPASGAYRVDIANVG